MGVSKKLVGLDLIQLVGAIPTRFVGRLYFSKSCFLIVTLQVTLHASYLVAKPVSKKIVFPRPVHMWKGQACADLNGRTPIGGSGNFVKCLTFRFVRVCIL